LPVFAFPGLQAGPDGTALRLFRTETQAGEETARGLSALLESGLRYELGWLERDLRALRDLGPLAATLAPAETLQQAALASLRAWAGRPERVVAGPLGNEAGLNQESMGDLAQAIGGANRPGEPRLVGDDSPCHQSRDTLATASGFAAALSQAKTDLRGIVPRFVDLLREILTLRQSLLVHPEPYDGLEKDLAALIGPEFLDEIPYERLVHVPRYLKGMQLRAQRWRKSPAKDAERARQLAPYVAAEAKQRARSGGGVSPLRWLVEEFRVSLFAQELGTAEPVSAVKLDQALARVSNPPAKSALFPSPPRPAPPPVPRLAVAEGEKPGPLKSLNALDRIFPRSGG
jgi:ATP-dependent helicase HrpA